MEWPAIIIALVALYGAVLSTYTLLSNRSDRRRHVKVDLSMGFLTFPDRLSSHMLLVTASNPGNRPVTVCGVGINLPNKKHLFFQHPRVMLTFLMNFKKEDNVLYGLKRRI